MALIKNFSSIFFSSPQKLLITIIFLAVSQPLTLFAQPASNGNTLMDLSAKLEVERSRTTKTLEQVNNRISSLEKNSAAETAEKPELSWLLQARDYRGDTWIAMRIASEVSQALGRGQRDVTIFRRKWAVATSPVSHLRAEALA